MTSPDAAQRFGPTAGSITGFFGLGVCGTTVVLALKDDLTPGSVRVAIAAAGAAVVVWTYLLRPRILLEAGGAVLVLRNPLSTWKIPLTSVRDVVVKAVTRVTTDDDTRYDAVAVGYPLRKLARAARPRLPDRDLAAPEAPALPRHHEQTAMVEAILGAADRARVFGVAGPPPRRTFAVAEIASFGTAVLAFAATYLF